MARSRRGGKRTPANPAPVSGPGALSARTDGGVQPIRARPAEFFGQRQQLVGQQQAAPLAAGGTIPPPSVGPVGAGGTAGNVFGPTTRPTEPAITGATRGLEETVAPDDLFPDDDPMLVARAIHSIYPHPSIARLFL